MFENLLRKEETPEDDEPKNPRRRQFLKTAAALGATGAVGYGGGTIISSFLKQVFKEKGPLTELPDDFWYQIVSNIYEKHGSVSELQLRASAIVEAIGLPSGPISAIGIDEDGERENVQKDAIIAKYLTNPAGVRISTKNFDIHSADFRLLYPDGFPEVLREVLDPRTLAIMDASYAHQVASEQGVVSPDQSMEYYRLQGGVDLFMQGCVHTAEWMREHDGYLVDTLKSAQVVAIEGLSDLPYGSSLEYRFAHSHEAESTFGHLMRSLTEDGYENLFAEVDVRDTSVVAYDSIVDTDGIVVFPDLPQSFFDDYYVYLTERQPRLASEIGSSESLQVLLQEQSTGTQEALNHISITHKGVMHTNSFFSAEKAERKTLPQGLEFGQKLFSDAMSALKLHLIGKLMNDGAIQKGPIVDVRGSAHTSGTSFFLRYPEYAAEIVLRSLHELTAGVAVKKENNEKTAEAHASEVFRDTNWVVASRLVGDLVFARVDEGQIYKEFANVWDVYGVDPATYTPTEEQIVDLLAKHGK